MEGVGGKNGILPYPYSICYSQQGIMVVYKIWGGQVWVFGRKLHQKGLTKPKIELHIVERRALSVIAAKQCYDFKPKEGHL